MDINMNSVNFAKGKDNWVYFITDGSDTLTENNTNGIKVFYDDGNFMSLKAKIWQSTMKDIYKMSWALIT